MQTDPQETAVLKVNTLGAFSVELAGKSLTEDCRRQQQIWTLFQYVLVFRKRRIPTDEIIDVLWREETANNPAKALQNLVYRLHRILSQDQPDAQRYIILKQGCYCWNQEASIEVDADRFEELNSKAMSKEQEGDTDAAIDLYKQCLSLYRGNYMSEIANAEWVLLSANYYKRLFINITTRVVSLLKSQMRYQEVLSICEAAFTIEPYEEPIHAVYIQTMVAMGKNKEARVQYEYITSALYREFGAKPSKMLKDTYRYISEEIHEIGTDLDVLQELLSEKDHVYEAFVCEPELFRSIYKLEARRALRNGQVVYLVLLTLFSANNIQFDHLVLANAMDHMDELLLSCLRRGDVVSRWNESQFVVMLASLTYEDGEMVIHRLMDKFQSSLGNANVQVKHKLQPLNSIL